jgi:Tfp pilus assembly protein PilO
VTLTDRDRKILIALVPVLVLIAYWFLVLGPKRDEATKAGDDVAAAEQRLDAARDQLQAAEGAKDTFKASYAQVVRLGKAIPSTVDMPSLLVQLDAAAAGTGITFTHIKTGERTAAAVATPAPVAGSESGTTGTPAAAGGDTAQSQPGQAAEAANNAQQTANQQSAAAENSGVSPSDTQTSTPAGSTDTTGATSGTAAPAGLETVPLELEFTGDFFNLADFFHDVKRFVSTTNSNVTVGGRLITVEGIKWSSDDDLFPKIRAQITATIYLSPKSQGTTAGATPSGPSTTTPAGSTPTDTTTPAATPTATATP